MNCWIFISHSNYFRFTLSKDYKRNWYQQKGFNKKFDNLILLIMFLIFHWVGDVRYGILDYQNNLLEIGT